jgi:hypothetical protein
MKNEGYKKVKGMMEERIEKNSLEECMHMTCNDNEYSMTGTSSHCPYKM